MGLYEEFRERKAAEEKIDFNSITKEELQKLFYDEGMSDRMIAELFGVTTSKVRYKRSKFGINIKELVFYKALENLPQEINKMSKNNLMVEKNITKISKAITHFAFRNGPIEDIHANNQLTEHDMKTLNCFMVNRLAYVFKLVIDEEWCELEFLINETDKLFGHDWNEAVPDDGGNRKLMQLYFEEFKKRQLD